MVSFYHEAHFDTSVLKYQSILKSLQTTYFHKLLLVLYNLLGTIHMLQLFDYLETEKLSINMK